MANTVNFGSSYSRNKPESLNSEIQALSSTLDREYDRLIKNSRGIHDPFILSNLEYFDPNSTDVNSSLRVINKNLNTLDNKVRVLDKNIRTASTLLEYNKKVLDKTNLVLNKALAQNDYYKRFSDFENKMESGHLDALINKKLDERDRIGAAGIGGSAGGGDGLLDNIIQGILGNKIGKAGKGLALARFALLGLRFLGPAAAVAMVMSPTPVGSNEDRDIRQMLADPEGFRRKEEAAAKAWAEKLRKEQEEKDRIRLLEEAKIREADRIARYRQEAQQRANERARLDSGGIGKDAYDTLMKYAKRAQLFQKVQSGYFNKIPSTDIHGNPIVRKEGFLEAFGNAFLSGDDRSLSIYGSPGYNGPYIDPELSGKGLKRTEISKDGTYLPNIASSQKKTQPSEDEVKAFLETIQKSNPTYQVQDLDELPKTIKDFDERVITLLYEEYAAAQRISDRNLEIEKRKKQLEELKGKHSEIKFGDRIAQVASLGGNEASLSSDLKKAIFGSTSIPDFKKYYEDIEELEKSKKDATLENYSQEFNYYDLIARDVIMNWHRAEINVNETLKVTSINRIVLAAPAIDIIGKVTFSQFGRSEFGTPGQNVGGLAGNDIGTGARFGDLAKEQFGIISSTSGYNIASSGLSTSGSSIGYSVIERPGMKQSTFQGRAGTSPKFMGGNSAKYAFDYFKSKGLTDAQSAGLVGNLMAESGQNLNPGSVGDGGKAYGIAQWHPDRQANFKRAFGKEIQGSSLEEQLEFVWWELNNTESKALQHLRNATDAESAARAVNNYYERSHSAFGRNPNNEAVRIGNASSIFGNYQGSTGFDAASNLSIAGGASSTSLAINDFNPGSSGGYANEKGNEYVPMGGLASVSMTNQGAIRNRAITQDLESKLQEAVYAVYGPGYRAEVYSGGQPGKGKGGKRVGSTRHDHGNAADVYIYDEKGNRVKGDALGRLGQYWAAKKYGGVGLEMRGGGIHLDTHSDRAPTWNYGGGETPAAKQMVQAGIKGVLPDNLYSTNNSGQILSDEERKRYEANKAFIEQPRPAPRMDREAKSKEQTKSTHDNINMSASSLANYAREIIA